MTEHKDGAQPWGLREHSAVVGKPDFSDEPPTVTAARPAAAALIAEHVEENLRLHARVNELERTITVLEAKLAAPESERLAELQKRVRRAIEMLDHPRGPMPVGEILAVLRV